MCPTPPTPMTAAVVPGASRGRSLLTAWYAVIPASACGATSAGLDAVRQRDERALVDEHVLGEAAVARQPGELVPLAVHVEPAAARHAEPAAVRRVDEHGVADLRRRHVVADRVHPAGVLVAEDDRQRQARRLHQPVDRVQVGRADAGAADLDDDVRAPVRLGLGPLDELERAVVLAEKRGSHAATHAAAASRRGSPFGSASRCSASRVASAMIVSDGFTESVRGTSDASPTKSRFTSCDSPLPVDDRPRRDRRPSGSCPARGSTRGRSSRPASRPPPRAPRG